MVTYRSLGSLTQKSLISSPCVITADAQEERGFWVANAVLVELRAALHVIIGGRRKSRSDLADENWAITRARCRIRANDGEACAREFFDGFWFQRHSPGSARCRHRFPRPELRNKWSWFGYCCVVFSFFGASGTLCENSTTSPSSIT